MQRPSVRGSEKWGEAAKGGFQIIPDALLRHQADLKLNSRDMCVLMNIIMHWWKSDHFPRVNRSTISERTGFTDEVIKTSLIKMIDKGYIKQVRGTDGAMSYDLNGLVKKLNILHALAD